MIEASRIMEGGGDISCSILGKGSEARAAALTSPYVRLVINQSSTEEMAERLAPAATEISRRRSGI